VLDDGRVVATGTPHALKSRLGTEMVELRDDSGRLVDEVATDGTVAGLRRAVDLLDKPGTEGRVALRSPSLDDVFLSLTGAASRSASSALEEKQ
jgi:ABC-2 type transport system ATP-binding protein